MKKILSFVLAMILVLSLAACAPAGGEGNATDTTAAKSAFMAGFGAGDITPEESLPLQGYGDGKDRMSTGFVSKLYSLAVVVTDTEGNSAVLISVDSAAIGTGNCNEIRSQINEKFGIPKENILISSIHQHSTPEPNYSGKYHDKLINNTVDAVKQALDNRAPAEMYVNTVQTQALSFVRHYWNKEGEIVTDNHGNGNSGYTGHESDADPDMQMIKFVRSGQTTLDGKEAKDIILVNFQAHPHLGASSNYYSAHADWPGIMRETVDEKLSCHTVYFSGAGGNLNSNSRIKEENLSTDYKHHGKRAANYVLKAEDSYVKAETGAVICKEVVNTYETDHSMDHMLEEATIIHNARSESLKKANEILKDYPQFFSVYHASAVVNKSKEDKTRDMVISAISFGDVAFTVHPYEMFDTNGMELKKGTVGNENYASDAQQENPFKMTIITTMSNGSNGYLPSALNCKNGGYSVDITYFAHGTAEKLVTDYLTILNELHG